MLFVDFDGGTYDETETLSPYYTGTAEQRQNIVRSFNHLVQYFAMFDLSITTDVRNIGARSRAKNWGWIVVSPDISGGTAKYNGIGTFSSSAKAKCGSASLTGSERSRRIAHELGHNMNLYHDGLYEQGEFCKFEDCKSWDGKYGTIMGADGNGERNGWGLALFDSERGGSADPKNLQDSMAKVRKTVREMGGSTLNDGWALDDHPDSTLYPFCRDELGKLYRVAVLGSPEDVDRFALNWSGGDLRVRFTAPGVSAALGDLTLYRDGVEVGKDSLTAAPAGLYTVEVRTQGGYGALGYYDIRLE